MSHRSARFLVIPWTTDSGISLDFDFVGRDEKDTMSSVNNNNKI